jgi:hypothetical protein
MIEIRSETVKMYEVAIDEEDKAASGEFCDAPVAAAKKKNRECA